MPDSYTPRFTLAGWRNVLAFDRHTYKVITLQSDAAQTTGTSRDSLSYSKKKTGRDPDHSLALSESYAVYLPPDTPESHSISWRLDNGRPC